MHYYNLYNLIDISVHSKIPDHILNDIEFQIGFFKNNSVTKSKYKIRVLPYSFKDFQTNKNDEIFHLIEGKQDKYYHDPIKKICIEKVNDGFYIYINEFGILINLFINIILAKENITMVHAAAVADNENNVILLPGPGGVGKTTIINHLIKEMGYKLLGDDIVGISSTGKCYAFPRKFVLKKYHLQTYKEVFQELRINETNFVTNQSNTKNTSILNFIIKHLKENLPLLGITRRILYYIGLIQYLRHKKTKVQSLKKNSMLYLSKKSLVMNQLLFQV